MRLRAFNLACAGFIGVGFILVGLAPAQPQSVEKSAAEKAEQQIVSKVVGVTDGDTITVLDDEKHQHKIRLEGIDAPERGQPMGTKAKGYAACATCLGGKVYERKRK